MKGPKIIIVSSSAERAQVTEKLRQQAPAPTPVQRVIQTKPIVEKPVQKAIEPIVSRMESLAVGQSTVATSAAPIRRPVEPIVSRMERRPSKIKPAKAEASSRFYSIDEFGQSFGHSASEVQAMIDDTKKLPKGVAALYIGGQWKLYVDVLHPVAKLVVEPVLEKKVEAPAPIVEAPKSEPKPVTKEELPEISPSALFQILEMSKQNYSDEALAKLFGCTAEQICLYKQMSPKVIEKRKPGRSPKASTIAASEVTVKPLEEKMEPQSKPKYSPPKYVSPEPEDLSKYEEPEEAEAPKKNVRAVLSIASLRDRFRQRCTKNGKHWLWIGMDLKAKPTFSIDGKPYPIKIASYMLYKTETNSPARIPEGFAVISSCSRFNCVSPQCINVVPEAVARAKTKITPDMVAEVSRLRQLGNDAKGISDVMLNISPKQAYLIDRGIIGGR